MAFECAVRGRFSILALASVSIGRGLAKFIYRILFPLFQVIHYLLLSADLELRHQNWTNKAGRTHPIVHRRPEVLTLERQQAQWNNNNNNFLPYCRDVNSGEIYCVCQQTGRKNNWPISVNAVDAVVQDKMKIYYNYVHERAKIRRRFGRRCRRRRRHTKTPFKQSSVGVSRRL